MGFNVFFIEASVILLSGSWHSIILALFKTFTGSTVKLLVFVVIFLAKALHICSLHLKGRVVFVILPILENSSGIVIVSIPKLERLQPLVSFICFLLVNGSPSNG